MFNSFKLRPAHFSRASEKFLGGFAPLNYGPARSTQQYSMHWANNETAAIEIFPNAHQKWRYMNIDLNNNVNQLILHKIVDLWIKL